MAFGSAEITALQDRINQDITLYFGTKEFSDTLANIDAIDVYANVKGDNLGLTNGSVSVTFKDADCSFADGNDDTFTEVSIPLRDLEVNKEWCIRDLENKYLNGRLSAGQRYEGLEGIEADIYGEVLKGTANLIETTLWQGTNAANSFQGMGTYAKANVASAIGGAAVGTVAPTLSTAYADVHAMMNAAITGDEVLADYVINGGASLWLDPQVMYFYTRDYQDTVGNVGNVNAADLNIDPFRLVEGTQCRFRPVSGLYGTGEMYLTFDGNFVFATDLLSDMRDFRLYMDQDMKNTRGWLQFKGGAGVRDISKVAIWDPA